MKKFATRLLLLIMVLSLLVPSFAFAADEDDAVTDEAIVALDEAADESARSVVILHTNDIHGYVVADDIAKIIGFDYIAGIKQDYIAQLGENVFLADAGDFSTGKPFASFSKGIAPVLAMNAAGYDVAIPGNHEFDFAGQLDVVLENAEFDFISANITKEVEDGESERPLAASTVLTAENGLQVGYIGITTPYTTTSANPLNTAGYSYGNLESIVADVTAEAAALREGGADIVVLLAHLGRSAAEGYDSSDNLALALEAGTVDAIIDGHSHTTPDKNEQVNGVWIVSTGGDGNQSVGVVTFVETEDGFDVDVSSIGFDAAREYAPVEEVTAILNELNAPILELRETVVAHSDVYLDGVRANVRSRETNLANTITDAIRIYTGADIAVTNGGSIRAAIEAGDITYADVFTTLPYTNNVIVAEVTGEAIVAALEHGVSGVENGAGAFLQVSGISYSFDLGMDVGSRITGVFVGEEAIDTEAVYTVVTNDFTAIGGDGYEMFKEPFSAPLSWTAPETSNGSPIITDIFAWYLGEFGPSEADGRISFIAPQAIRPAYATVIVDGEEIAFDAFEILDNNYFKLRDLAFVLSGTDVQFGITFDDDGIYLTSGETYEAVGDELEAREVESTRAYTTDVVVYLDGEAITITGYNIEGYNYFKLRDLAAALDFGVEWDDATSTINVVTADSYVI